MELRTWSGDITKMGVDAIANAANTELAPGGGVCGAIFRAAGSRLIGACEAIGGCPTGGAVATLGFDLPARWVIHAVGPVWRGGHDGEREALASCYRRIAEIAAELGARSVAIPAISTGIYGFPADEAAAIAVSTLRSLPAEVADAIDEITLVAFDDATARRYRELLEP